MKLNLSTKILGIHLLFLQSKNSIFRFLSIVLLNTILFMLLILLLRPFQLIGTDDSGLYLSLIYHIAQHGNFSFDYYCDINYLSNHFSPFWALFAPFSMFFSSPVSFYYFIAGIGYVSFVSSCAYLYLQKPSVRSITLFFMVFFLSVTVLFQFSLNYNGIHDVLFAAPFLTFSYYCIFIKERYPAGIIWFLPTLLIKEEFYLIAIFVILAIAIKSKKYIYFTAAFTFIIIFYLLYFEYMRSLYSGDNVANLGNIYSYLFESSDPKSIIQGIVDNNDWVREPLLIFLFFLPFLPLIKFKSFEARDLLAFSIIVLPTIGYCFLASGTRLSNFLFDHYGYPILPLLLVFIIKYGEISNKRISLYLFLNIALISFIISQKQPWQYKYYQDEAQLINNIFPMFDKEKDTKVATEGRTGIYFADRRLMAINMCEDEKPDYIVLNTRYLYSASNLSRAALKSGSRVGTHEKVQEMRLDEYSLIYKNYPFLVYSSNSESSSHYAIQKSELESWDSKTIASNTWLSDE